MIDELPDGWATVRLGQCVDVLDGMRVPVNSDERAKRPGKIPYYGATGQVGWIDDYIFNEPLVLLGEDGAPFLDKSKDHAYLIRGKSWVNNHAHVLRAIPGLTTNEYIKYTLDGFDFHDYVNGTTRLKLTKGAMVTMPVRLAPLAEQNRIVGRVEALLAEMDTSREHLKKVSVILRRFRHAVLVAACSGRLTEEWRDQHPELEAPKGIEPSSTRRPGRLWGAGEVPELTNEERLLIPDSWRWLKVGQLGADAVQIGPMSMKSSEFSESGVPVLNVGCVQPGWIDLSKCDFLPKTTAAAFDRYRIKAGDVLFTRSGTVGRCAVAEAVHTGDVITFHLLRVRPDPGRCMPRYLWAVFQGAPSIRRQTEEGQIGSTRGGFNTGLLASLDVPVPPIREQEEILRRVDALFALADTIEKQVADASARADKLTQSTLAKAFRGELVPTEAELARQEGRDYEPASLLLERIREHVDKEPAESVATPARTGPGRSRGSVRRARARQPGRRSTR